MGQPLEYPWPWNLIVSSSVKSLESQIADLENESEALSRSVEAQKHRTSEAEATGQKRVNDLSKELQRKVSIPMCYFFPIAYTVILGFGN